MTSQGQRFRRRALRRGYKVDEVDAFLDRVEATLAGEQSGAPVGAQEVHDVVFRVRFGGGAPSVHHRQLTCGQLAARTVDLPPASVPDGGRHSRFAQPADELPLDRLGAGVPLAARCRVERDQIHMRQLAVQQPAEQVGAPRLIVYVPDQGVFDGDPATGLRRVVERGIEHLGHLPTLVDGHKLIAQIIIGGMQGQRKSHGQLFGDQPPHCGHEAHGGDRDVPL